MMHQPHTANDRPPLAELIYDHIKEWGHVTFYEIEEEFGTGNILTSTNGLYDLNIVLWIGLSEEVAKAIGDLHSEGKIEYVPCDWMTYLITGQIIDLPVARNPPKKGYKKQHWLPVFLKVVTEE